jgi:uncharacterized protein
MRANLASAECFEDPDAVQQGWWLTLGERLEQIRWAYQRFRTRFEIDEQGALTLHFVLDFGGVANGTSPHGNEHWEFDQNGPMRRRDASINDYEIEESERRYRY